MRTGLLGQLRRGTFADLRRSRRTVVDRDNAELRRPTEAATGLAAQGAVCVAAILLADFVEQVPVVTRLSAD